MNLFLLALIAHFIGDFILQTERIIAEKCTYKIRGFLKHFLMIMLLTFIATHYYGIKQALIYSLLIGLTHLAVDGVKVLLEEGKSGGTKLIFFLIDQALHLILLLIFTCFFNTTTIDPAVSAFYQRLFRPEVIPVLAGKSRIITLDLEKVLWVVSIYLSAIFGGTVLITRILGWLTNRPQEERVQRLGRAIGVMERLILITLVVTDAISAMGFVLAAKSLARYKELNDREFAEYYLVGTLASFSLALFAGLWLRKIL